LNKLLFAGSFDPPTWGHLDIIQRASKLCTTLYIGVARNTAKEHLLTADERASLIAKLTKKIKNVEVQLIDGLVIDFVKSHNINALVRSIRGCADLSQEEALASGNQWMAGIETILLFSDPKYSNIHSSLVREIALMGGPLNAFVPPEVATVLEQHL
jgi:pantetheine-phosphate adenylyltransferase